MGGGVRLWQVRWEWCRYQSWSEAVGKASASVAVLYSGGYGFSDRLSQTLARGLTKAGVATEMVDVLGADMQVCHRLVSDALRTLWLCCSLARSLTMPAAHLKRCHSQLCCAGAVLHAV